MSQRWHNVQAYIKCTVNYTFMQKVIYNVTDGEECSEDILMLHSTKRATQYIFVGRPQHLGNSSFVRAEEPRFSITSSHTDHNFYLINRRPSESTAKDYVYTNHHALHRADPERN